jgi:hypothetical protein
MSDVITIPTGTTGIDDIDPFAGLKIYPNPNPGLFTIEMNNQLFGDLMIGIFSEEGKEIINIKFKKTTEYFSSQINMSRQPKGYYLITFDLNKKIAVRKIIIE